MAQLRRVLRHVGWAPSGDGDDGDCDGSSVSGSCDDDNGYKMYDGIYDSIYGGDSGGANGVYRGADGVRGDDGGASSVRGGGGDGDSGGGVSLDGGNGDGFPLDHGRPLSAPRPISEGGGLVLCGLSLGGVVSLRYSDKYPSEVGRIILVSSPGLDERWWVASAFTRPLRLAVLGAAHAADAGWVGGDVGRWIVRRFTPVKHFLSHVHLVRDTPTFGVPPDMPERLKARGKPLVLVWGRLDQFHTPQLRWGAGGVSS